MNANKLTRNMKVFFGAAVFLGISLIVAPLIQHMPKAPAYANSARQAVEAKVETEGMAPVIKISLADDIRYTGNVDTGYKLFTASSPDPLTRLQDVRHLWPNLSVVVRQDANNPLNAPVVAWQTGQTMIGNLTAPAAMPAMGKASQFETRPPVAYVLQGDGVQALLIQGRQEFEVRKFAFAGISWHPLGSEFLFSAKDSANDPWVLYRVIMASGQSASAERLFPTSVTDSMIFPTYCGNDLVVSVRNEKGWDLVRFEKFSHRNDIRLTDLGDAFDPECHPDNGDIVYTRSRSNGEFNEKLVDDSLVGDIHENDGFVLPYGSIHVIRSGGLPEFLGWGQMPTWDLPTAALSSDLPTATPTALPTPTATATLTPTLAATATSTPEPKTFVEVTYNGSYANCWGDYDARKDLTKLTKGNEYEVVLGPDEAPTTSTWTGGVDNKTSNKQFKLQVGDDVCFVREQLVEVVTKEE